MISKISDHCEDNKAIVWLMLVGVPISVLVIGSLLARDIFWDSFLWRYFWGPVVADAEGRTINGISSGYNVVNTATYGIILVISFFGILELIEHFEVEINRKFIFALVPWIILGGSLRSLEDAGLFSDPLDKFFIAPMIYFLLGLSAISLMLIGAYLSTKGWTDKISRIFRLLILAPLPIIYVTFRNYIDPFFMSFIVVILLSLALSYLIGVRYLEFNEKYLFFTYGTTLVSLSLTFNIYFILFKDATNPYEAPTILGLASAFTLLLLGFFWIIDRISFEMLPGKSFDILRKPVNVLLIWVHLFDASSTYRGITVYGYTEKHVLPTYLIDVTGPFIIVVANIVLVLVAIYVLDVMLEEDFSGDERLRIFLKFVIIVLGAAPAIRNTLRLAMGV